MPNALPFSSTARAESSATWARWISPRFTGTASIASKKPRITRPLKPLPCQYSTLARKLIGRGAVSGITTLSMKDRWLLARITPPLRGTFSRPSTTGR